MAQQTQQQEAVAPNSVTVIYSNFEGLKNTKLGLRARIDNHYSLVLYHHILSRLDNYRLK